MTQQIEVCSFSDFDDATDSKASHPTLVKPHAVQSLAQVGNSILERNGMSPCDWYRGHQVKGGEEVWKFAPLGEVAAIPAVYKTVLASNYTGLDGDVKLEDALYIGDHIYFDFDAPYIEDVISKVQEFAQKFEAMGVNPDSFKWWASGGKGFHCFIPLELIKENGAAGLKLFELQELPIIFREFAESVFVDSLDLSVYSKRRGRQWRQENIQRPNGAYKVPLSYSEVRRMTPELYSELVSAPRDIPNEVKVLQVSTELLNLWTNACDKVGTGQKRIADKRAKATPLTPAHTDRLESLLEVIGPDDGSYQDWFKGVAAIHEYYAGSEDGYKVAREWSQRGPKFKDGASFEATWDALFADYSSNVTIATLIQQTRENKIEWFDPHPELNPTHDPVVNEEATPLKLTEAAFAEFLARKYASIIKYVEDLGKWIVWKDGAREWEFDTEGAYIRNLVVTEARKQLVLASSQQAAAIAEDQSGDAVKSENQKFLAASRFYLGLESAKGIRAVASLMPDQSHLRVGHLLLDSDIYLLNVNNGTIDLRTGNLLPHDPNNLITQRAYVDYLPNATCPRWEKFIDDVTVGRKDLATYIQRILGYSLTGDVSRHEAYFMHGGGGNGKSVLSNIIKKVLGTYCKTLKADALMVRRDPSAPTPDLSVLVGARAVFTSELERGRQLGEGIFKDVVSGDIVPLRGLYAKNVVNFVPCCKIFLPLNDLPIVSGMDRGIWRRIWAIPFDATFEGKSRDLELPHKLEAELPGILAWLVRGCLDVRRNDIVVPLCVIEKTREYRNELDILQQFVDDVLICCINEDTGDCGDAKIPASLLNQVFGHYCVTMNRPRVSGRLFSQDIKKHLTHHSRGSGGIVYKGWRISKDWVPERMRESFLKFIEDATIDF